MIPAPKTLRETTHRHVLTVHIEDYFQVGPVSPAIPLRYWPRFETRVEKNTLAALDLLDRHGHKATFFTLGWIADHLPDVVKEVARRGHEVASKGYYHRSLGQMSREEFRADIVRSRIALEGATGVAVDGFRIARGWFSPADLWTLQVLAEEGYAYDSSLRPFGLSFGRNTIGRTAFTRRFGSKSVSELPLAASRLGPLSLPISGGNYIRQFPHDFMKSRIARWVETTPSPLVFYFHVWELDPDQPRITALPHLNRLRQYRNLERMSERVGYYLETYRFGTAASHLGLARREATLSPARVTASALGANSAPGRRPVTVVVPCYNEEPTLKYLKNTLDLFALAHDSTLDLSFVFVDDCSTDGTPELLHELFGGRANCQIIQHARNRGVAAGTMTGIRAARTETVCVIDCDCSYDPGYLAKMVPMLTDGVDLVTASPYHRNGITVNVPGWRLFLSRSLSMLYQRTLNARLATYTACFRVYRRAAVKDIAITNEGYLGIAEILARMDLAGAKIVECPAVLEARLLGKSKMSIVHTSIGHLRLLSQLWLERLQFSRLKPGRIIHDKVERP